jgi:mediator of RNA polymerase II transcription subunit 14
MTDTARKRTLADWVVKTKKQVVKLYAIVKWSRDAESLQKCMVCGMPPAQSHIYTHI